MGSVIDNVVAHFDAQEIKTINVPEWGDDEGPLVIYTKPLTLQESKRLYKEGNKIFTVADKDALMNKADINVLAEVAGNILGSMTPEDAEK